MDAATKQINSTLDYTKTVFVPKTTCNVQQYPSFTQFINIVYSHRLTHNIAIILMKPAMSHTFVKEINFTDINANDSDEDDEIISMQMQEPLSINMNGFNEINSERLTRQPTMLEKIHEDNEFDDEDEDEDEQFDIDEDDEEMDSFDLGLPSLSAFNQFKHNPHPVKIEFKQIKIFYAISCKQLKQNSTVCVVWFILLNKRQQFHLILITLHCALILRISDDHTITFFSKCDTFYI